MVVNSFVNSFTTSNPMNIKIKNISMSVSLVMKNKNSVHMIMTRVIFSDINNLVFFIETKFLLIHEPLVLFGIPISDIITTRRHPIKIIVKLVFRFKITGLKRKTTPIIISIIPMILVRV